MSEGATIRASREIAEALSVDTSIVWHQRFQLAETVWSPGAHDIAQLIDRLMLPARLDGLSVLDIGTCNGGAAFIAERRGAERVVGVDIYPPSHFGFDRIREGIGSNAEFVQASIYDLPRIMAERFDVVLFLGVLYHLRHPLLAIDSLRKLTGGTVYVETAVCAARPEGAHTEFYATDALQGDGSNWFVPSTTCLSDWFTSSGFTADRVETWPEPNPRRAFLVGRPTAAVAYRSLSYEVPLSVVADVQRANSDETA
jgi:tRNA (mo5U34)-methyltransferase